MAPKIQKADWNRAVGMLIIIAAVYIVLQQFGLMPRGPLQAAQLYALANSPLKSVLTITFFALGAALLTFSLWAFASAAGKKSMRKVITVGAVMVAALGLGMLSQGWNMLSLFTWAWHNDDAAVDIAIDKKILEERQRPPARDGEPCCPQPIQIQPQHANIEIVDDGEE